MKSTLGYQLLGHAAAVGAAAHHFGYAFKVNHVAALVQHSPLFSGISLAACGEIVSAAHEKKFVRSQTIFSQGDPVRHVLVLTSGCVKISQLARNGAEVILRLNGPGEAVGTNALSTHSNHASAAQALRSSTALAWDASVFEVISERLPIVRRNVARILCQRLEDMEERFREVSTEMTAARLRCQIIRLMRQVGLPVDGTIEITISREELGQLIGATVFTVSRLLCEWERQGIVRNRRQTVIVCNPPAFVELAESD